MKKTALLISLVALFATFLGACGVANVPSQTQDVNAMYTQAVQTIMAQLTSDAVSALATQSAAGGQATQPVGLPAETFTPVPASATLQPTATQTTAATATATATATQVPPTPTLSGEDIVKTLGGSTLRFDFDNEQGWNFSQYFKDTDPIQMAVKDGKVEMKAVYADYNYQWLLTWPKPEDFYVEITATTGSECAGLDKYGMIFRAPDPSKGYLVAFSCDGRYSLWYFDGEKEVDILDWKTSDKIKAGPNQTNRLGIKAQGNQLTIYANGLAIDTLTDTKESKGQFGLMVGAVKTPNFTVYVDKMEYWDFTK
jgi:hypothetical protein